MHFKKKRMSIICLWGWFILCALSLAPLLNAAPKPTTRNDGLTIIKAEISKENNSALCFLTLILKTGYAADPASKAGLTQLTNQLLYRVFLNSAAIDIQYHTYANFSQFDFIIAARNFKSFSAELDAAIRMEALLLYDECHEAIRDYQNTPRLPGAAGLIDLYQMLYGNGHPYLAVFNGNFPALDINLVNEWFRKIYRPSNLIIASSADLPADFLLKPSGRDLKEPVTFDKTPPAACVPIPVIHYTQASNNISSIRIGLPGPALNDNALFAMIILKRYLQRQLGNKLREEMGLCNDIRVNYSYLQEPAAPPLIISLETLPEDEDTAIATIVAVLQQIATVDITAEQLAVIKEQEQKRIKLQKSSILHKMDGLAYEKLFTAPWLNDSEEYCKRISQVTAADLAKLLTSRLKYLKIAVAGPAPEAVFKQTRAALAKLDRPEK